MIPNRLRTLGRRIGQLVGVLRDGFRTLAMLPQAESGESGLPLCVFGPGGEYRTAWLPGPSFSTDTARVPAGGLAAVAVGVAQGAERPAPGRPVLRRVALGAGGANGPKR